MYQLDVLNPRDASGHGEGNVRVYSCGELERHHAVAGLHVDPVPSHAGMAGEGDLHLGCQDSVGHELSGCVRGGELRSPGQIGEEFRRRLAGEGAAVLMRTS
jgi:hypothetical protein